MCVTKSLFIPTLSILQSYNQKLKDNNNNKNFDEWNNLLTRKIDSLINNYIYSPILNNTLKN